MLTSKSDPTVFMVVLNVLDVVLYVTILFAPTLIFVLSILPEVVK